MDFVDKANFPDPITYTVNAIHLILKYTLNPLKYMFHTMCV